MGLSVEKITTFIAYWLAVGLAYFGAMTEHEVTRLDASDLISLAGKVVGFLSPASGR